MVLPALTLALGGATETVTVTTETSLIQAQSGERSFTIGTDSVANLPTLEPKLHGPGDAGAGRDGRCQQHAGPRRRWRLHQHRHGRRVGQRHGFEPAVDADERRVDRGGQGHDVGLSGRVRPREWRSGHGGHQGRNQPVLLARSTMSSAIPTGMPTARRTSSTAIPKTVREGTRLGFHGGRSGRQGLAARTSCSSSTRRRCCLGPRVATCSGSACQPLLERAG